MDNSFIPFGDFSNVKVGDEVILHTWVNNSIGTIHRFFRDKVISVDEKTFMISMREHQYSKCNGNVFDMDCVNCNVFPMEILEKFRITLEN